MANSRYMPWGYPEGVDTAKNHMGHLFEPRLEPWTTNSQNWGFHPGHFWLNLSTRAC